MELGQPETINTGEMVLPFCRDNCQDFHAKPTSQNSLGAAATAALERTSSPNDNSLLHQPHRRPTAAIMATELTVQSERAYQKQPHIFLNHKAKSKAAKSKRIGKAGRRWYKDVGLGFRTPKTAISGSYIGQSIQERALKESRAHRSEKRWI
jgi:hypothetical protein